MFEKVNIQDLKFNPFDEISNHWVLIFSYWFNYWYISGKMLHRN